MLSLGKAINHNKLKRASCWKNTKQKCPSHGQVILNDWKFDGEKFHNLSKWHAAIQKRPHRPTQQLAGFQAKRRTTHRQKSSRRHLCYFALTGFGGLSRPQSIGGGDPNILKMGQQQGEERYLAFWNIITARCPRWTLKGGKPESFYLKNGTNQRKILTYTWGNWMLPNLVWERQDRFLPRRENLGWNFRSSISLTLLNIPTLPPLSHLCLCSVTSASYICIA